LIPGGNLKRDPTIVFSDSKLFVVAQGTDDQFYWSSYATDSVFDSAHWTSWQLIEGGPWMSEAGVVAKPGGRLFIAALAADGHYYLTRSSDSAASWAPWTLVESGDHNFNSAPALAAAPTASGSLSIFGTGLDEQLWMSTSSDDGRSWRPFDSTPNSRLVSGPAAVSPIEGFAHLFSRATDQAVWMDPCRP